MLKLLQMTSFFIFFSVERVSVLEAQDVRSKATSPDLGLAKPRSAAAAFLNGKAIGSERCLDCLKHAGFQFNECLQFRFDPL